MCYKLSHYAYNSTSNEGRLYWRTNFTTTRSKCATHIYRGSSGKYYKRICPSRVQITDYTLPSSPQWYKVSVNDIKDWCQGTLRLCWHTETVFTHVAGSDDKSGGTRPWWWQAMDNVSQISSAINWLPAIPCDLGTKSKGPTRSLSSPVKSIVTLYLLCFSRLGRPLGLIKMHRS